MEDPFEQILARRKSQRDGQNEEQVTSSEGVQSGRGAIPRRGNHRGRGTSYSPHRGQGWRNRENAFVDSEEFYDRPRSRGRGENRGRGRRSWGGGSSHRQTYASREATRQTISPYQLVGILSDYPDFRGSLLNLMEEKGLQPSAVREAALAYTNVFSMEGEHVVLRPKVGICRKHFGPQGCEDRTACKDLHICFLFVSSHCNDNVCALGHSWTTNHNSKILQLFYIDRVRFGILRKLIQSLSVTKGPVGQLDICAHYNGRGCNKTDCGSLHVCHNFIVGLANCSRKGCKLNHNLSLPECSHLLLTHGFSINEAARDIAGTLLAANPALSRMDIGNSESSNTDRKTATDSRKASSSGISNKTSKPTKKVESSSSDDDDSSSSDSDDSSSSDSDDSSSSDSDSSIKQAKKRSSKDRKTKVTKSSTRNQTGTRDQSTLSPPNANTHQTVWTHHLYGDTPINELCYYSVESSCRSESSGCRRLHSALHYHWQVSEQGSKWLNLRRRQVKALELSFCQPENTGVALPRLDPAELDSSNKYLLSVMGRDSWKANFQAMVITNSSQSRVLTLRRLCTEKIHGKEIRENTFNWYFVDKNRKWVMYGKVDTAGETNLVSSVTSNAIEKHFHQTQASPLTFRNSQFTYILDFNAMTQTNQQTQVRREVRRRPVPHIKISKPPTTTSGAGSGSSTSDLPATWEPMQPQERMRLVDVAPTSAEYQGVVSLIQGQGNNIRKIQRVQNPFLWRAFQNKVREMTTVYGDVSKVNIRQIFHGTSHNVVASICSENFDWRLHGTSAGQAHGRGTYFSPDFGTSYGYCKPDPSGVRYMFVARVAVGFVTGGSSTTVRPPMNPATNVPFDSTGNGTTVVVKYDKQEYYPEYVLSF